MQLNSKERKRKIHERDEEASTSGWGNCMKHIPALQSSQDSEQPPVEPQPDVHESTHL
jgi:hypothetical protein